MFFIIIKWIITASIVVAVSEIAKRSSIFAAIIASLPLTSILAITWLYTETRDSQKVIDLSTGILWAIIPSIVFFIALPIMIKFGWSFYYALAGSCIIMASTYFIYVVAMKALGIQI